MKQVVGAVQGITLLCTLAFAVLLFANEPGAPSDAGGADVAATSNTAKVSGATVYANRCAGCHGGDGDGGLGPQLSGGRMIARFPDIAAQIAVITDGRGGMPGFGDKLRAEEIAAVAEYERSL